MPDARCTRGPVCKKEEENAHEHTGSAEAIRHSLRNGFTAYVALSPVIGLVWHRRLANMAVRARLGWQASGRLDANHGGVRTTRFCRTQQPVFARRLRRATPVIARRLAGEGAVRQRAVWSLTDSREPALPSRFTPDAAASTASRPASL